MDKNKDKVIEFLSYVLLASVTLLIASFAAYVFAMAKFAICR